MESSNKKTILIYWKVLIYVPVYAHCLLGIVITVIINHRHVNYTKVSILFCFEMAVTNAERMKKYREKLKKDKVRYEAMKEKARNRNNSIRKKLTGTKLTEFRANNRDR